MKSVYELNRAPKSNVLVFWSLVSSYTITLLTPAGSHNLCGLFLNYKREITVFRQVKWSAAGASSAAPVEASSSKLCRDEQWRNRWESRRL